METVAKARELTVASPSNDYTLVSIRAVYGIELTGSYADIANEHFVCWMTMWSRSQTYAIDYLSINYTFELIELSPVMIF